MDCPCQQTQPEDSRRSFVHFLPQGAFDTKTQHLRAWIVQRLYRMRLSAQNARTQHTHVEVYLTPGLESRLPVLKGCHISQQTLQELIAHLY